jgi:hypothetical protein
MGGAEGDDLVPTMPPSLRHLYVVSPARHRVDTLRRTLYALGATRALAFMNWQQRLQDAKHKLRAKKIQVGGSGDQARCARCYWESALPVSSN